MNNTPAPLDSQPLVSVLMPLTMASPYAREAIESIFRQSYCNWELLLAVDRSDEASRACIAPYLNDPRVKCYHHDRSEGRIQTRNQLLDKARGSLITLQYAAQVSHPNRLSRQVEALKAAFPAIKATATASFHAPVAFPSSQHPDRPPQYTVTLQSPQLDFALPSLMIHQSLYETVGGLPLYFEPLLGEDEYWIRRILLHTTCLVINAPLYRYHPDLPPLMTAFKTHRKLVGIKILELLCKQLQETQSDWLAEGEYEQLAAFEAHLLKDRSYLGEQYRRLAAMAFQQRQFSVGWALLLKSWGKAPMKPKTYRTALYGIQKFFSAPLSVRSALNRP